MFGTNQIYYSEIEKKIPDSLNTFFAGKRIPIIVATNIIATSSNSFTEMIAPENYTVIRLGIYFSYFNIVGSTRICSK